MKAVIDSDVLIDYLQGVEAARRELNQYSELCYSVISWMEILIGAETPGEEKSARTFLASLRMIELTREIASQAVSERKRSKLKLPDAIILATADVEGCILVTRNTKDFQKRDPRVRFPYQTETDL
ncbi:MAG TPA: type II toxin-antitoxin system VapC family toxin [Chthoniobacterales bacterium]